MTSEQTRAVRAGVDEVGRQPQAGDGGFSLIEVVVAMAVFTVLASISLGILVNTTSVTRSNINRTTAANLAAKQIESVRTSAATDIATGTVTTSQTVHGTTFTIKTTGTFVSSNGASSACAGTGTSLSYKAVTVRVTWPDMGQVKPVRTDTLKAVSIGSGGLDSDLGSLALLVNGATSVPQANIPVTISSGSTTASGTTGDDGCVVFTNLAVGSYTATLSVPGYVGTLNTQVTSVGSLGVTAGGLTQNSIYYDTVDNLALSFDSPATATIPAGIPTLIGGTFRTEYRLPTCPSTVTDSCTTGAPGTVQALYPDNYKVRVGACSDSSTATVTVDTRLSATPSTPVVIPVGAPTVTIKTLLGAQVAARAVNITHIAPNTGCTSGETYTFTSVPSGTQVAIPYGSWTISTTSGSIGTGLTLSANVMLSASNKTPTIALVVAS